MNHKIRNEYFGIHKYVMNPVDNTLDQEAGFSEILRNRGIIEFCEDIMHLQKHIESVARFPHFAGVTNSEYSEILESVLYNCVELQRQDQGSRSGQISRERKRKRSE